MRTRTIWVGLVVAMATALAPLAARGQDYTPPDPQVPLPLFHDRPESGGLFVAGEFLYFQQTNPLKHQLIAGRGLVDVDGSISADLNGIPNPAPPPTIIPGPAQPGRFIGSGAPALYADQARGPVDFTPGFDVTIGWKFSSGIVLELDWWHFMESKAAAEATLVPPNLQAGQLLEETFLFSPVFNFPNAYAGPANKLALGNPLAAYGIWNGATEMQVEFVQRFDQVELTGRIPIYENDNVRCYGLVGPRYDWIWEKFRWRTVATDFLGNAGPDDVAIYNNIVSNRMYGVSIGGGTEWRLGDTPAGTFSLSLDTKVFGEIDFAQERAKYERGDYYTAAKRAVSQYTFVPGFDVRPHLWWYPVEGVQIRIGYNMLGFFNTVSSPYPVDFNYGQLDPGWKTTQFRFLDGLDAGIGFIF